MYLKKIIMVWEALGRQRFLKILMHYKISHSPDGCPPVCCVERCWHRQSPAFTCPESAGKWNDALQYRLKSTEMGIGMNSLALHI